MMLTAKLIALLSAGLALSAPILPREATLDPAAVAEAQQRDDTATRAFSASEIKTADGQCLSVDPLSGDFRENLIPIQIAACNGSDSQQWDVITSGKHNDQPGFALIVSTLTNGCLNFDPRRAAGNQVILFSCGGRADGGGTVTNSQLFAFSGGSGPLPLVPQNGNNATCLTVNGELLDQTSCSPDTASGNELFTIGDSTGSASASEASTVSASVASTESSAATTSSSVVECAVPPATTTAAATTSAATTSAATTSAAATSAVTTPAATSTVLTSSAAVPSSTGGTVLDPAAVAEAQQRDNTATRAFSNAQVKTSDGQCLSVNANAGDFRENLIPVTVGACDGSAGQKFDVITQGIHNNVNGTALIVSTLTQGCLNFDPRRAAGDQVILFSCGGRADGSGQVTNSQLFTFTGGDAPIPLVPTNVQNTCLVNNNGILDTTSCDTTSPSQDELFTFVQ